MRILALDWGTVRIGAAISDEEQRIAFPLEKYLEKKTAITEILSLLKKYEFERVLVGLPKTLTDKQSNSAEKVKKFVKILSAKTGLLIELIDERFSTVLADNMFNDLNLNGKKRKQMIDNLAAQAILQQYLNSKRT